MAVLTTATIGSLSTASADGASRGAAERGSGARSRPLHRRRYGISFGYRAWDVDCERRGKGRWWCGVTSEGGQCFGNLTLRERGRGFIASKRTISCME
ncbi:hypothetical protein C8N24_0678 [Solirubrobacter pauli]|uniref:Uncharacterized protein n=1 Tax=Solirubrobacter pauli TaxID=166793 RepID=A0A660LAF8_9ACTN|nr:hypothetical protein [Solirubrobacter pauli]RKQ90863.1 hypothetical protein C8N24_0678 [Solirubrobacter pauli]